MEIFASFAQAYARRVRAQGILAKSVTCQVGRSHGPLIVGLVNSAARHT
jgi:hypothetical protein